MRACLVAQARFAIEAGIDVVQVRERDLESGELAALVSELVALAAAAPVISTVAGGRTRIIVNDRLDVALAAGASGVHLRSDSVSPSMARSMAPPGFLIGCSVHSPAEAAAIGSDVDYLIAGTVWASDSKPDGHPVLGTDGLAAIVKAARVPVLGIGGVTASRASALAAAGAAGVAAIGLFMSARQARAAATRPAGGPPACRAVPLSAIAASTRAGFGIT